MERCESQVIRGGSPHQILVYSPNWIIRHISKINIWESFVSRPCSAPCCTNGKKPLFIARERRGPSRPGLLWTLPRPQAPSQMPKKVPNIFKNIFISTTHDFHDGSSVCDEYSLPVFLERHTIDTIRLSLETSLGWINSKRSKLCVNNHLEG